MEFSKALKLNAKRNDGYLESENWIITWCVGHLVTMSYPEKYDENLKFWRLDTLPFIPKEWKYEIIPAVQKQFCYKDRYNNCACCLNLHHYTRQYLLPVFFRQNPS